MQLSHHLDNLSSLCTLVDLVMFDELGVQDGRLSPDEFIQAFGTCFKGVIIILSVLLACVKNILFA